MPSPFTLDRVLAAGVRAFTVYNHMLLPTVYESLEADYRHLTEKVQLWDVAGERQVEVRGRDALALVEWMTPRDVGRCAEGTASIPRELQAQAVEAIATGDACPRTTIGGTRRHESRS